MIRVTVELISAIDPSRSKLLGIAEISNDGQTSDETDGQFGSYDISLSKWAPKEKQVWKKGRAENINRRTRGAWDILFVGLRDIVGKRNPPC